MKFSSPNITSLEVDAVANAVREGHLADGFYVAQFEQALAAFGYDHVVAMNSGTSALTVALELLGVGQGDEVIVPAYGIMCTPNAVWANDGTVVWCDVDRTTYNMDVASMLEVLSCRTKAVMPVSLFGSPVDTRALREALDKEGRQDVHIVEDSIEALGATLHGHPVGHYADIATFGFYPNKQITTANGGALVTSRRVYAEAARRLIQHGYPASGASLWEPGYGHNLRLPDVLAALGVVQLSRFEEMQDQLMAVRQVYDSALGGFRTQVPVQGATTTEFVYVIQLPPSVDKKEFGLHLEEEGVPNRPYFRHLPPDGAGGVPVLPLPNREALGSSTIALPFHYGVGLDAVAKISRKVLALLEVS